MSYCINCGKELNEGAKFCFYCGASVPQEQTDPEPTTSANASAQPPIIPEAASSDDKKKKRNRFPIGLCLAITLPLLLLGIILFALISPDQAFLKDYTKEQVLDFWQDWDANMELVSITYDSIDESEWKADEIRAYIQKIGDQAITEYDSDGSETNWDSHWDYWKSKKYDPYKDTYKVYTIRGDYHVTDNRKADYEGWYCITIVHATNQNTYFMDGVEVELPDELKQYLPD